MGLKSGSRDAGLDESDDEDEQSINQETSAITETDEDDEYDDTTDVGDAGMKSETTSSAEITTSTETTRNKGSTQSRPAMDSIPYKLRRDKVNEGREQVPYFLREEIIDAEDELQDTLEEILGEDVYKSDYREAAMVVAQRNPALVAEVLREWGYDLEPS